MTDGKPDPDTRTRILEAAQQLFVERGFHGTALQEIADRVGITKPALYYYFASKGELLGSLLDPMTDELERVLDEAEAAGRSGGLAVLRTVLFTGWVDIFLRNRGTVVALIRDLAATPAGSFHRMLLVMERAFTAAAGPNAGLAERVAVAQVVSAITDPVALLPEEPAEALREPLLAGAWRLLGQPPPAPRQVRVGRPRSLSAEELAAASASYRSGTSSVEELAERFGVSRATMYRHLKNSSETL